MSTVVTQKELHRALKQRLQMKYNENRYRVVEESDRHTTLKTFRGAFSQMPDTGEQVVCTGCGKHLLRSEAHYGNHAATYTGTTWHCDQYWAICSQEVE